MERRESVRLRNQISEMEGALTAHAQNSRILEHEISRLRTTVHSLATTHTEATMALPPRGSKTRQSRRTYSRTGLTSAGQASFPVDTVLTEGVPLEDMLLTNQQGASLASSAPATAPRYEQSYDLTQNWNSHGSLDTRSSASLSQATHAHRRAQTTATARRGPAAFAQHFNTTMGALPHVAAGSQQERSSNCRPPVDNPTTPGMVELKRRRGLARASAGHAGDGMEPGGFQEGGRPGTTASAMRRTATATSRLRKSASSGSMRGRAKTPLTHPGSLYVGSGLGLRKEVFSSGRQGSTKHICKQIMDEMNASQ